MTINQKIKYLKDNYPDEYKKAREQAITIVDNKFPIVCPCGKLATGLHTNSCSTFNKFVNREIVMLLNKLLP